MKLSAYRLKRFSFISLTLFSITILASFTDCKRDAKDKILIQIIPQILSEFHLSPMELNDSFSVKVYKQYLKHIDYSKRFLTKEDLAILDKYKYKIDNEILSQEMNLYCKANEILKVNTEKIEGYYTEILSKPFDYTTNETYQSDPEKSDFPANNDSLKVIWKKALKYEVMTRLSDMVEDQEKQDTIKKKTDNVTTIEENLKKKTFAQLEDSARAKVLKLYKDRFKRLKNSSEAEKSSMFYNAITAIYDPHTSYLSPSEKDNFNIGMTGQLEGIGAILSETESGLIRIVEIVPGSASWRQGELKKDDLIMKVAQANAEPVDITDMRLDEVVKLIRGKKGTTVLLTVKKIDGSIKKISIVRDVVINEESYAKSAIIEEQNKKIGYLYLPKFYANFERTQTGRSCSDDVAIELEKLKAENVSGIVFDLRNNGGGSLQDVIKMGGLFIATGPIVQVKDYRYPAKVNMDLDPKIQYSGPLVFLVNEFSASASEILAAAMQDYKRAIIMGTNTFGKGTVQTQLNLNDLDGFEVAKNGQLGGMLITIQKFYRINGSSTQMKGVTPDIILPDLYSQLGYGEAQEDYCLPYSKINALNYNTWQGIKNFDEIVKSSNEAISKNTDFKAINDQALELKKQKDNTIVSLNLDKFKLKEKETQLKTKKIEKIGKKESGLKIEVLKADISNPKDTTKAIRYEKWVKDLKKDIYLKEAVSVVEKISDK